ncbi:MAG: peptide chain release factor N(5)-glutamine methyltransferase [Actinomycetota bacterium]|nr:peptide chain release factor N(5)-glutamine methyltransferase [Actinomycetota bacterium]
MTIGEAIKQATLQLEGGSLISARVEAERIVGEALGFERADLYLYSEQELTAGAQAFITVAVAERLGGRPLQYILGHQCFRHLDLVCRENVLIPRPETELLVEEVLAGLDDLRTLGVPLVLDIGSGTGAISLSIAYEYSQARVVATDISDEAVALTRENAARNGLLDRVTVAQGDLFDGLQDYRGCVDIVVSNPPYIKTSDLDGLQGEVRREPRLALDGGEDGLDFYRVIIKEAPAFLKPGGLLFFEIGFDQAADIVAICEKSGSFKDVEVRKDYLENDRIIKARRI